MRPVMVIVRDGWGYNENPKGNAVMAAKTVNIDAYKNKYPWILIETSGEAVGLPPGFQGSSEVGHLNMGAGRVVIQELKRIDDGFKDGSIFKNEKWRALIDNWKSNQSRLHLFGLLQDEGVHAHMDHLFKIMRQARKEYPQGEIVIHPFLDGRDTPPRSCMEYLAKLNKVMQEVGSCRIGTVMGRYYAMDRSRDWTLTDQAYNCIVSAQGRRASSAEQAVKESYEKDRTPDDVEMFDEYIPPYVIGDYDGVHDGDSVFHTNYRQDRAIQLSMAFVEDTYPGQRSKRPKVIYLGFTQYYDEFENYLMASMTSSGNMENILGEVLSKAGLKQLRIAETQKFRHVTSFFNGKLTTPFPGEDQVEIKSTIDPAAYASHPEMEAYRVTEELLKRLENNPYAFILVNYANGDMVGHTGDFEAAKRAIEVVDECVGRIVKRMLELDGRILITADHGNSEQMIDYETGMVKTSHTTFPVEFIYVAKDAPGVQLKETGKLADIAPTVLKLLGLPIPDEMTADVLIK
ncbi:2,3-bisphosphoglycerate-independent phosphoglycerate mutase [Caldithrix abyssi DSM 13497]|uniref:2,3-bisphosphoglycerate-independent phosphoglycerate mutase n=2 Tax=Caldithrix abyssi DSM 13497 TaxID=880073 RepID=H1XUT9_CALAY|nr:2,3-bisphosphoglycerate-independent phosphoglycerate mutase [Caldithrix abyssi]EHO41638.1 2,3-bisphosphoglycerate-independent phosphoglycerate mutase [Caldithrix abyssi DSM 13497]